MADRLRMGYINSLPQPFIVRLCGDRDYSWPVYDIDVESSLMRIDVCGKLECKRFADVVQIKDADGIEHDPDTFYTDWEPSDGQK